MRYSPTSSTSWCITINRERWNRSSNQRTGSATNCLKPTRHHSDSGQVSGAGPARLGARPSIEEVDDHSQSKPDEKPDPCTEGQAHHLDETGKDTKNRHEGDERRSERP